jgi:hypothetical protein
MTDNDFRQTILERLIERNKLESGFHEIIINSELNFHCFVLIRQLLEIKKYFLMTFNLQTIALSNGIIN